MNPFNDLLVIGLATLAFSIYDLTIWPSESPVSPEVDWTMTATMLASVIVVIGGVIGRFVQKSPGKEENGKYPRESLWSLLLLPFLFLSLSGCAEQCGPDQTPTKVVDESEGYRYDYGYSYGYGYCPAEGKYWYCYNYNYHYGWFPEKSHIECMQTSSQEANE